MANYTKFYAFTENLAEGVHDFSSHVVKVALSNVAPNLTDAVLADITEIDYTNCSNRATTTISSSQTAGVYTLKLDDLTLQASDPVGPFRYIILYNDTQTTPLKPLIGFYDYGASITLLRNESLLLDFDDTNGVFQVT